jgi:hypothetical protein
MKFTEAQLESAIIEPGEPEGSNYELSIMSDEQLLCRMMKDEL